MQRVRRVVLSGLFACALVAVAGGAQTSSAVAAPRLGGDAALAARIVLPPKPLQCVPFARKVSGLPIFGDAWTWWRSAKGKYERGQRPRPGAVMVFSKTKRNRYGHLAVVKRILNSREVVVDHSNWLNRGRIHLNSTVRDVSPNNDWSAVRVWYTPGKRYGARVYSLTGFIYGDGQAGAAQPEVREADPLQDPRRLKRIRERLRAAKAEAVQLAEAKLTTEDVPMPRRRPAMHLAVLRTSQNAAAAKAGIPRIEPLPTSLQSATRALRDATAALNRGR